MLNKKLFDDYIKRGKIRFKVLKDFMDEDDYGDVIRVSQEIVELVEKAILIKMGINPPKWHDVIDVILENSDKLNENIVEELRHLRRGAKWLRSQREISFYGDLDFTPSDDYSKDDALKAVEIARRFLDLIDSI